MSRQANPANKDKYIDVATSIMAKSGFNGVSIRDICRLTNTSVSSIYYHFKNKEELYIEIFCSQFNPLEKKLVEVSEKYTNLNERLFALIDTFIDELSANENLWRLLMHISIDSSTNNLSEIGKKSFIRCFRIFYDTILGITNNGELAQLKAMFIFSLCLLPFQGKDIWPLLPGYRSEPLSTEALKDYIREAIAKGIL